MVKRHAAILLCLCCLGGCRNYQELSGFDFAVGLAVDWAGGQLEVTVEILDLSGSEEAIAGKIVTCRGETLPKALDDLRTRLSKTLYLGNLQEIIIGEEAAREVGLYTLCDWFLRDAKVRETVPLLIAGGVPAGEILQSPGLDNPIASYAISGILIPTDGTVHNPLRVNLYEVYGALDEPGRVLSLPCVALLPNGEEMTAAVDGSAVFKEDRLASYIGPEHLTAYLLLQNQLQRAELVIETPNGPATVRITKGQTKTAFAAEGDSVRFSFASTAEGSVLQLPPGINATESMAQLERLASEALERKIRALLTLLQDELKADVPGLGQLIYQKDRVLWDRVGGDWESRFPALRLDVNAECKLYNAGAVRKS